MAGVATAFSPAGAWANEFRRINDINVSCNNALRCDLFITNPRVTLSNFGLRRAAAPDAPVSIVLTSREAFARGSMITVLIDGAEIASVPAEDFSYRAAVSEYFYSEQQVVRDTIEAAKNGSQLQIQYQARLGPTSASFELEGFSEGLAFLDRVQGRTGRDDALSVSLGGPMVGEEGYTAIASLSDVSFAVRSRFFSGSTALCAGLTPAGQANFDGFALSLGDEQTLYGLPCGQAGELGTPLAFFTVEGRDAERLALPVITTQGITTRYSASEAAFDAAQGQLTGIQIEAGGPDCGTYGVWSLGQDPDGSPAFTLTEARTVADCTSDGAANPEDWPLVWPAGAAATAD